MPTEMWYSRSPSCPSYVIIGCKCWPRSFLYVSPFLTFGLASFWCCKCRTKLGVFSTVLGVYGGTSFVPTGLFWLPVSNVGILLWRVSQKVGIYFLKVAKCTLVIIVSLLQPNWAKASAKFGCSGVRCGPKCLRAHLRPDFGLVWAARLSSTSCQEPILSRVYFLSFVSPGSGSTSPLCCQSSKFSNASSSFM